MVTIYSAKNKKLTEAEFRKLYNIIIKAYADTEATMWGQHYVRIAEDDFRKFIQADQVLVAFIGEEIVGGIRYYKCAPDTYSFGLFGADFARSREGIGRALISGVENEVKKAGFSKIKIEILRPKNFELPIKTVLHNWYQRLGYKHSGTVDFQAEFPDQAVGILIPCLFDFYEKEF